MYNIEKDRKVKIRETGIKISRKGYLLYINQELNKNVCLTIIDGKLTALTW